MASRIKIGDPVNAAEQWAFDFLVKELPDSYMLLTNVEVYTESGRPFEVDAIVIGEFAVYVIDIKGYSEILDATPNTWSHNNNPVENPLCKLNQNARVLAGRTKKHLSAGEYSPWVQGLAFITGGKGGSILINKDQESLPIYDKTSIVKALTDSSFVTSLYKSPMTKQQKDSTILSLGDMSIMKDAQYHLDGFVKQCLLGKSGGVEVWSGRLSKFSLPTEYKLSVVDLTALSHDSQEFYRQKFKQHFYLLHELSDIEEVPTVSSVVDDGQHLLLAQSYAVGTPFREASSNQNWQTFAKQLALALSKIFGKGLKVLSLTFDEVLITESGLFLDIGINSSAKPKKIHQVFWDIVDASSVSIDDLPVKLRSEFELYRSGAALELTMDEVAAAWISNREASVDSEFVVRPGAVLNDKYEFIKLLGSGATAEVWRAKHLLGNYDCSIKVLNRASIPDDHTLREFEILRTSFHPNITRVFDLDKLPGSGYYYLTGQLHAGFTLKEVEDTSSLWDWFRQSLEALQYLHRIGVVHKDVKPSNIIIENNKPYLIDFNISQSSDTEVGTLSYKYPMVAKEGWSSTADVFSLLISFLEVATGTHPFTSNQNIPCLPNDVSLSSLMLKLPQKTIGKMAQVLNGQVKFSEVHDYAGWFGLSEKPTIEIPDSIKSEWGIRSGYMTKVLVSMIADNQPRSRSVIISNVLKENGIVGNKTNRGSVSAAISALKASEVIEYLGKKIALSSEFMCEFQMAN